MAQAGIGWAQPDVEQQQIERARQMAMALRQQAQPQGQSVSGHYIAPSWTEQLASALSPWAADQADKRTDERQTALAEKLRAEGMQDVQNFMDAMQGSAARSIQPLTPNDDEGNINPNIDVAAQGPDRNKALAIALGSKNPMMQQMGGSLLSSLMPKTPEWTLGERFNDKTGQKEKFMFDKNNPSNMQAIGGQEALKGVAINDTLVNPVTGVKIGGPVSNPLKDNLVMGPGDLPIPNAPMLDFKKQVATAGKPQISVDARNFNTQESEQSKAYGKQLGEMRGAIMQAGFDAPKKIAQLDRMEDLLKGVDGGATAPAMADLASAANSLGIKLDPKLGNKQAAEALAIGMAQNMRQPGTGPMTDKDMDQFIRQVPGLAKTAEGRAEITKTMRAAIERDQRAAKFASEYASKNGGVIDDNYMNAVSDFYAKNPVVTPKMPANNSRGQPFTDPGKEDRYQAWKRSQGMK